MNVTDEQILSLFREHPDQSLHFAFIFKALNLDRRAKGDLKQALKQLVRAQRLECSRGKHYRLPRRQSSLGTLTLTASGVGFITPDRGGSDVFVSPSALVGVTEGDRVEYVHVQGRGGRPAARIERLVERTARPLFGVLQHWRGSYFVDDAEPSIRTRVWLEPDPRLTPQAAGQLAALELSSKPETQRIGVLGRLQRLLGKPGSFAAEFERMFHSFDLPGEFPAEVLAEAKRVEALAPGDRSDLRHVPFVTIDGDNARDFDDAVALTEEQGEPVLWVAIADVAHFVRERSALDEEALARGTSVYFPNRVIHMLPSTLSEGLCSLRPHEDRLAIVARIRNPRSATTDDVTFFEASIHSRARLTYTQVYRFLERRAPLFAEPPDDAAELETMIDELFALTRVLREQRFDGGSLALEIPEPDFELDESGENVLRVTARVANDATTLIEELMLLANRLVADWMAAREVPALYRTHDPADLGKLEAVRELFGRLGIAVEASDKLSDPARKLLEVTIGHPLQNFLHKQVLCSLPQAEYRPTNDGHYGLHFDSYLHFTSPIRRYPDLFVHRQLKTALRSKETHFSARHPTVRKRVTELAEQTAARERIAKSAERESDTLFLLRYLERHLGEAFPGTITGVSEFGCFVELDDLMVSGLVHYRDLADFAYQPKAHGFRHLQSGELLCVADRIVVRLNRIDLRRRHLDLAFL
ncbi:MAG: VacB/RNase II family 3'-5' exoribonuclease [Myxococcales bacterium]|nr:VacB/RNase II family 3'-5' exoribonuclease [Myxococcales bacterium]